MIKKGSSCNFLDKICSLINYINSKASSNLKISLMSSLTIAEEKNPSKGHGFELVPIHAESLMPPQYDA